jgi:hypothetical protein
LDWGWQRIGAKKGGGKKELHCDHLFYGHGRSPDLLNACPDIPKHMGKGILLAL